MYRRRYSFYFLLYDTIESSSHLHIDIFIFSHLLSRSWTYPQSRLTNSNLRGLSLKFELVSFSIW